MSKERLSVDELIKESLEEATETENEAVSAAIVILTKNGFMFCRSTETPIASFGMFEFAKLECAEDFVRKESEGIGGFYQKDKSELTADEVIDYCKSPEMLEDGETISKIVVTVETSNGFVFTHTNAMTHVASGLCDFALREYREDLYKAPDHPAKAAEED